MTPGDDDPFGRRGEDEGSGLPGGWLPPTSGRDEPREEERRPLWSRPESPGSGAGDPGSQGPIFEQPGRQERIPAPVVGGATRNSGRATASLVLGIVGLVVCPFVCSVLAIVFGTRARREIDASGGAVTGRGNATAGIVLGWVGLGLSLLFILLIVIGTITLDSDTGTGDGGGDSLLSLIHIALA